MLEEALVIFACLNGTGCSETSNQYFAVHPEVKEVVDREGRVIREYIGPTVVDTLGPAIFVVAGGTGTIRITKYFSLQFNKQNGIISFRKDY